MTDYADMTQVNRSIDLGNQATDRAFAVLNRVESARPRNQDLVHAARAALAWAEDVERKAYDRAANQLLDTPGVRHLLEVLEQVNDRLEILTDDLEATLKSLQDFAKVASGVVGVIKAFRA